MQNTVRTDVVPRPSPGGVELEMAYRPFIRAAELQDMGEPSTAAAWQTLGMTVCALLSSGYRPRVTAATADRRRQAGDAKSPPTDASEGSAPPLSRPVDAQLDRLDRELKFLLEAGQRGGNVSAATVQRIAEALSHELSHLRNALAAVLGR